MSYIKNTLLSDEKILYFTRPHWIIFFQPLLWIFIGSTSFIVLKWNAYLGFLPIIYGIFSAVSSLISYYFSEYGITDKRVLIKTGLVRRKSFEIFLKRIEGVYIDQSILGRIFDYGIVVISGIGGSKDFFPYIPTPLKFRSKVQELIASNISTIA